MSAKIKLLGAFFERARLISALLGISATSLRNSGWFSSIKKCIITNLEGELRAVAFRLLLRHKRQFINNKFIVIINHGQLGTVASFCKCKDYRLLIVCCWFA